MTRHLLAALALAGPALAEDVAAPAAPPAPDVSILLDGRQGRVVPSRAGFTHTGGGNIDVAQPSPDTVVVTVTGVAVAGGMPGRDSAATMTADVLQRFTVSFDKPTVKRAKLTVEGRVVGLLRSQRKGNGSAAITTATAAVQCEPAGPEPLAGLCLPSHSVGGGQSLSINDHEGPRAVLIGPGCYTLHQQFAVTASHPRRVLPCKTASAEFAPDPALDPLWISYWEPFHGAAKKDFGFQVTVKVAPVETPAPESAAKADEPAAKKDEPAAGPKPLPRLVRRK